MAITGNIEDDNGAFIGPHTAENADALYAYARSQGLLVGDHGGEGGPGPTIEVPSDLLFAILDAHGPASPHATSPTVAALDGWMKSGR